MSPTVLARAFRKRILVIGVFIVTATLSQAPRVVAQHPQGHAAGGVRGPVVGRPTIPRLPTPVISHPPVFANRPISGVVAPGSVFRTGPILFPRRHVFFLREPFVGFGAELWLQSNWLASCGSFWTWELGCYTLPVYPNSYATYPVPEPYAVPVYVYGAERHDQVQLFLKDGTIYNVNDYWFVNDEVHFTMLQELPDGGFRNVERVTAEDQLDVPTTIDVNTQRGFRLVKREEPWRKYLHDHPDSIPPALAPPSR